MLQILNSYHNIILWNILIGFGLLFLVYLPVTSYAELSTEVNVQFEKVARDITVQTFVGLSNDEKNETLQKLSMQEQKNLEQLFQESLPEITSERIVKKDGFFHGVDDHSARGYAEITLRDGLPYLVLKDIEVSYAGFEKDHDLYVYLTRDGNIETGIELGTLNSIMPYHTYGLFDPIPLEYPEKKLEARMSVYDPRYNVIVIFDKTPNKPIAKAELFQTGSFNSLLSNISNAFMLTASVPKTIPSGDNMMTNSGFFHGVDDHSARGYAEITLRDGLPYLVLKDIEVSYAGFEKDHDLYVYLTRDGNIETGIELGLLQPEIVQVMYTLSGIETHNFNTVVIADESTRNPYASATLGQEYDFFGFLSGYLQQDSIKEPKITTGIIQQQQVGYFQNVNALNSKGIAKVFKSDKSALVELSNFDIQYDKEQYVRINNNVYLAEPDLHVYFAKKNQLNEAIYLGNLETNVPEVQFHKVFQQNNGDKLDGYDLIIVFDETAKKTFITSNLQKPWFFGTSPFLFVEWLTLFFPKDVMLILLVLIFPLTFDYFRIIGKITVLSVLSFRKRNKPHKTSLNKPKITIMIPAHNEEAGIRDSINSVLSTSYPNKEIIVIDDGSTDKTYNIAKEFSDKGLIKLIHRDEASGSKATALNYGSNYATGDLLLCMDGDTKLDEQALTNLYPYFENNSVLAVSGNVKILAGDPGKDKKPVHNTLTKLQSYEYLIAMELGRKFMSVIDMVLIISGAFGIFRKRDFNSIGKYDKDNITEDFDLTLKIKKGKGKIEFVDDAIAWTYCPNNLRAWIKQRTRWAYGQIQTLRKHNNVIRNRRFKITYSIAAVDMWLLDVVLNFLFIIYIIGITVALIFNLIDTSLFANVIILVTIAYIIIETVIFLIASSISANKTTKKLVYLAPLMAVFYRPLLRLVIFNAYLQSLLRKKIAWG